MKPNGIRIQPDEFVVVLEECRGNLHRVAAQLGVSRRSVFKYVEGRKAVKEALTDIREGAIDEAETFLEERIETDPQLLMFFLRTRGQKRGYAESKSIELTITQLQGMSDAELQSILEE